MQVQSLYWEDLLEESVATHSSGLAWRTPTQGRQESDTTKWPCRHIHTEYVQRFQFTHSPLVQGTYHQDKIYIALQKKKLSKIQRIQIFEFEFNT